MGSGCSTPEMKVQAARNRQIEKEIEKDRHEHFGDQKLLLLGTGECGKSTILKQMQILHREGFPNSERIHLKSTIFTNLVKDMEKVLRAMEFFGLGDESLSDYCRSVYNVIKGGEDLHTFPHELSLALQTLWVHPGVQATFERRCEYQVSDCVQYFMDDFSRLIQNDYIPSVDDILRVRVPTAGIVQVTFPIKGVKFRVFDVGGQRSERRKWIHLFEDVNAIIYISAVSEYDQVIMEDHLTNRLTESMQLFEQICNCKWFTRASFILFLNKKDLFAQKVTHKPITPLFPDYNGPMDYGAVMSFIGKKFLAYNREAMRRIYVHETCATDTNQVQIVIDAVIDTVIAKNLRGTGMS